jgi:hypothetical protein
VRVKKKVCKPIADHIEQATTYYCAPACGAMVLRTTKHAPAGTDKFVQDQVWAQVQLASTGASWTPPPSCKDGEVSGFPNQHCYVCGSCWNCWASTSDALASALDYFGARADVVRDNSVDRAALLSAVVASLDQSFPAIVGMGSETHWEVIAGYCLDEHKPPDSQSLKIGTRQVASFYLIDPMFPSPPGVMVAVPAFGVLSAIGFARCGPPTDNGFSLAIVKSVSPRPAKMAVSVMTNALPATGGPLRSSNVVMEAARAIERNLVLNPQWEYAFQGAELQKPAVIQSLDDRDGYYYIVDFMKEGVTGRVALALDPIRILRVEGSTIPGTFLPAFVTPQATLTEREGRAFSESDGRIVRKDAIGIHPVLVWRDCAQSHNQMWPFYVMTHGDRRYYQRVDGAIFPELTRPLSGQ